MIFDKKEQTCVDVTKHPYFKEYEIAITLNGLILMLQYGNVICIADSSRFSTDAVEIYNKNTGQIVNTSIESYFNGYEVAVTYDELQQPAILMIQYGSVICSAPSELYGVRCKNDTNLENVDLLSSEKEVYQYIVSYIHEHKYGPIYDEIIQHTKVRSKSTICLHIRKLLNLGLLESDAPGSARALRLPDAV